MEQIGWDLNPTILYQYSTIVLQEISWKTSIFLVFKGNEMILLRKSTDDANYYLQQTICFM